MLRNHFISKGAGGWSGRTGTEVGEQDPSQLLLPQEPASPLRCKQDEGTRLLGQPLQVSPPSCDPGTRSATQDFASPASSAKPFELAPRLFNVAVPDTANTTGARWLTPAGCRCRLRQRSYEGCVAISVVHPSFQRFQPEPFLSAFQEFLNLLNPAFGVVRRNNRATSCLR